MVADMNIDVVANMDDDVAADKATIWKVVMTWLPHGY